MLPSFLFFSYVHSLCAHSSAVYVCLILSLFLQSIILLSPLLLSPCDLLCLSLHFSVYSVAPTSVFFECPCIFSISTHCVLSISLSPSHSLIDKSLPCLFERKTDSHSFAPCVSFSPSSLHSCLSF